MTAKEARAVKDCSFRQVRQALSGFHLGFERDECWRVRTRIGRAFFLSVEKYGSEASAARAAKRIDAALRASPPSSEQEQPT